MVDDGEVLRVMIQQDKKTKCVPGTVMCAIIPSEANTSRRLCTFLFMPNLPSLSSPFYMY